MLVAVVINVNDTVTSQWALNVSSACLLGRRHTPCAILTRATQTILSLPGEISFMHPNCHLDRTMGSTFGSARSPADMLQDSFVHLLPSVSVRRYSHTHLLQNWSVRNCAWCHLFLEHIPHSQNTPVASLDFVVQAGSGSASGIQDRLCHQSKRWAVDCWWSTPIRSTLSTNLLFW